jgi:hypothetical protein
MSDLNIRINLDTNAAEAGANDVRNDLNRIRTEGERPVRVNVDRSQLDAATGGAGKLREALGNVQAAALGELSQKAGQLGASLGGVAGSVAEVAIKSAAAFGPIGIAITAVLAALALVKQAVDENNAATERTEEITQGLAEANRVLGGTYSTVTAAANAATTAEAARLAIAREMQAIGREQLGLIGQGADVTQAATLTEAFQTLSDATKDARTNLAVLTPAMIQHAVISGNAAEQTAVLGMSFVRAREPTVAMAQATELVLRRLRELANNEKTNAQQRVRVAQEAVAHETSRRVEGESALERYQRIVAAETRVVTARNQLTTATAAAATAEQNFANQQNQVVIAGTKAAEAAAALEAARRRQAAEAAAASVETGAQRRAGMEALRLAEQGLLTAGQEISVSEQQTRAEQALAFAVRETTRARAASARGGQTGAERTALVTALNNEATARRGVADALERQMQSLLDFDNKQRQLRADRLVVSERERVQEEGDKARNQANVNAARAMQDVRERREEADKARNAANFHATSDKLAKEEEDRNESLKQSAGGLAKAQIHALLSAAIAGEDAGAAAKAALGASLASLAEEAAMKSLFKLAEGFGYLATPGMQANATAAFTSAAIFGGVAIAAGGGAIGIAAADREAKKGGTAGGGGAGAGATPMRSSGGGGEAPKNITINFSAFQSNEQAQALIVRSLREAGYNGRARVGSSFSAERR